MAGPAVRRPVRWSRPTTARSASRGRRSSGRRLLEDPQRRCRASRRAWTCCTTASWKGRISRKRWIEIACDNAREDVRPLPAQGHDRAGSRRRHRRLRPGAHAGALGLDPPRTWTTPATRGARPPARCARCCRAGARSSTAASTSARRATAPTCPGPPASTCGDDDGHRTGPADRPARAEDRRPARTRRGAGVQPRLDVRLAHPLAGALRPVRAGAGAHRADGRRADGHQPEHPGLDGHRLPARHAARAVRQPHDLRHRPRRLRRARAGPPADDAGAARGVDARHPKGSPRGVQQTSAARPCRSPGGPREPSCRCGWPATGRRRSTWWGARPTGSSCSSPTPTSSSGRSRPSVPRRRRRARPGVDHDLRRGSRLRHRRQRRLLGPCPRPVPLVRRDGGQPCRRPRDQVRVGVGDVARRAYRLHQGPRGLRLLPPRPRREHHHELRAR